MSIVHVVKDDEPRAILGVAKPVLEKSESICFRFLSASDSKFVQCVRNILLQTLGGAGVEPEDPCIGRLLPEATGVFYGELGFPGL